MRNHRKPASDRVATDEDGAQSATALSDSEISASVGVDVYTYVSDPQFSTTITAPGITGSYGTSDNFTKHSLQIQSDGILEGVDCQLAWQATSGNGTIGQGNEVIDTLTKDLVSGTMSMMMNTPSSIESGAALSYGFYKASLGNETLLASRDQLYVYVSDDCSNWMGDLVSQYPQVRDFAFQQFALPGAHDAGMFSLQTVESLLNSSYLDALLGTLSVIGPLLADLAESAILRAVTNLAITQKDDVPTMLNLGVRYFDFRPGMMAPLLADYSPGALYHQHSVVPGYPYVDFLQDVLSWLSSNPSEIVVVSANTQGFYYPSAMAPSPQDVADDLNKALANTGLMGKIEIGDKSSLSQSVGELLNSNTRLIFLNQISSPPETIKYDSYSDQNYSTANPDTIIQALEGMNREGQGGADYTVLQMQGTTTQIPGIIAPSILTLSDASSPLMSTKAGFDSVTNSWLLANVSANLLNSQLVVFLNDFVDNCMVNTAITVSKQRMGLG